jgi:hypothetical protein
MSLVDALPYVRGSDAMFDDFKRIRDLFRAEWERYNGLLQNCLNYSEEYISLCEIAISEPPSREGMAFAGDVLAMGRRVYNQAMDARSRHDQLNRELRRHRPRLLSVFTSVESGRSGQRSGKWIHILILFT